MLRLSRKSTNYEGYLKASSDTACGCHLFATRSMPPKHVFCSHFAITSRGVVPNRPTCLSSLSLTAWTRCRGRYVAF
jgi:hypothetical protein